MQRTTKKTVTNLSTQSKPSISQTETMDQERVTAGRNYRPLSTEKRIPRSISQKYPPTFHLTMQTDQMDSEGTVAGRSYRQQPTKTDAKTIKQSITLAMKTITIKQMIIESEDNNKTTKDPSTKYNTNKIVQIINQEKKSHLKYIPNKNQEFQTLHNPKAKFLQSPHLQNQVKLRGKLQYLNKGYNKPTNTILEAKQVNLSPYPISPQGVSKLEPTPTLLTSSHPSRSGEKRQKQLQLLKTRTQNAPKATRPVQDPRSRNKDLTPKSRQKQSPIPRLTSWISWTEQERKEERREGRDLENRETDKKNREKLDGYGEQTARYLKQWETTNMKDFIQQGFTLQWKDDQSINNLQRQLKIMKFRGTDEEAREYKKMFLPMRVIVSIIEGVVKEICEVYCVVDLCNLRLCLGLLEYSSQIVQVKWSFLVLNAFLSSFHLLLDLFPFVIVVVGIVIGSQPIVSYQIRSISPSPFAYGVHHPPTSPLLHRFTGLPCFLS
ncbi:MAG: hypothetical protein EZS28_037964, partial [Streblomastix strix]